MPISAVSFLRALVPAIGLSSAAMAAAVILQGVILFPQHLRTLREPPKVEIRRLMAFGSGQCAALLRLQTPLLVGELQNHALCACKLGPDETRPHRLPFDFTLWKVATSRVGSRMFLSSPEGNIYSHDPSLPQSMPRLLGNHPAGFADLECAHDGSIAIACNHGITTGWQYGTPLPLWQRTDTEFTCICFHPASLRLFCGLGTGNGVELDPLSGATLREFHTHWDTPIALDISADGQCIAALGDNGSCVVTDLQQNRRLWERHFPPPVAQPRFSPDGKLLLTPSPTRSPSLNVVSASTGELVAELKGATAEIAGIEVTSSGLVCAWDAAGSITVWNLASGALLHRFQLECLPEIKASS